LKEFAITIKVIEYYYNHSNRILCFELILTHTRTQS